MSGNRKKGPREKDLTSRYLTGNLDEDRVDSQQRFSRRSADAQQRKMERTALLRAAEESVESAADMEALPVGEVIQVYSLYYEVEHSERQYLCVLRKTVSKLLDTAIIVGDRVRFRDIGAVDERGRPEAVIEQLLPRRTILTRSDSFKAIEQHPIVANAEQMLIVVSLREPTVRWGLVDRMIVAALAGGLKPIVCLNKLDLARSGDEDSQMAEKVMAHYELLGLTTLRTSVHGGVGLEQLRMLLKDRTTVLAGHSGVGKSSLVRAVQPELDLRVGAISGYTGKGRHTTTSARRYRLAGGGYVIDTPGVELFGLWGVTEENLGAFFPDVREGRAPAWRVASYGRILESITSGPRG
jgi:ribosome biogenesis GTPase